MSSSTGEWTVNASTGNLDWKTDTIDADEPSGTLEFSISGSDDADAFFPINVAFVSAGSMAEVEVESASLVEGSESVDFSQEMVLSTDSYLVV